MAYSCCNPFSLPGHESSSHKKSLRTVQHWRIEKAPQIPIGSKICDNCQKKLSKVSSKPATPSPVSEISDSERYFDRQEAVTSLNVCLNEIGETPYSQVRSRGKGYSRQKVEKIRHWGALVLVRDHLMMVKKCLSNWKKNLRWWLTAAKNCSFWLFYQKVGQWEESNRSFMYPTIWLENPKSFHRKNESFHFQIHEVVLLFFRKHLVLFSNFICQMK